MSAIILIYALSYLWIIPKRHDAILNDFAKGLLSIRLPEESKLIDSTSIVGQQQGNSDHCDYLAAIILDSSLPKQRLQDYYDQNYTGNSEIEFVWLDENNIYTTEEFDFRAIRTLKTWISDNRENEHASVVVYIFEAGLTSAFDYRCS